jgi:hypothetical protein
MVILIALEPGRDEPIGRRLAASPRRCLLTEYPLFARAKDEVGLWGGMPAARHRYSHNRLASELLESFGSQRGLPHRLRHSPKMRLGG